ncbi:TasA family protein [Methanofollis sp. W23]|uniref:TasA family protein n=1 Tax=Methanofollis sp. W23 TaxID=2817849 RepID=UPI001AE82CD1|nr:TasA family protein [Methanofollis sp. W23]
MDATKKILLASIGIALVAFLIGGGTYAYFSDIEKTQNSTFTAGTLDLDLGDVTVPVAVDPLKPGDKDETYAEWTLTNTGNVAGVLNVSVGVVSGNEGGNPNEPEGDAEEGTSVGLEERLNVSLWIEQDTEKKYLKPEGDSLVWADTETYALLNDFSGKSTTETISQGTGDPNLGTFHIAYDLPYETGNEVQGDSCSFNVTFELRQPPQQP